MLRYLTKIAAPLALLALAMPAQAKPIQAEVGADAGHMVRYSARLAANGAIVITGTEVGTASAVDLSVDGAGRVTGTYGGSPVDFSISAAQHDRLVADLADSPTSASVVATGYTR